MEESLATIPEDLQGKPLEIVFREPILTVKKSMQPKLNQVYTALPGNRGRLTSLARIYYLVVLDKELPLIVYPGEFEIVGEATEKFDWKPKNYFV